MISQNLNDKDKALIARLSAMSADDFNTCLEAYGLYQSNYNQWFSYEEQVDLINDESDDFLPELENYFEFENPDAIIRIQENMRAAILEARQDDSQIDLQDLFMDIMREIIKEDLTLNYAITGQMFEDIAQMDEEVYHGRLEWSMIEGNGKDFNNANYITKNG